jgi:hypothetical protein
VKAVEHGARAAQVALGVEICSKKSQHAAAARFIFVNRLGKRLTSLCMKSQMLQQVVLHTSHWGTGSFSKGAGESSHEFCTDPPRQGEIFHRGGGAFKIGRMASTRFGAF